jgi:glutathione peroxidase
MSYFRFAVAAGLLAGFVAAGAAEEKKMSALDFKLKGIDGKQVDLAQYKGKVVLFVNVASQCGYTPQYKDLQELYSKYEKEGLVVIGIPSNDFKGQEPGTDEEIKSFCITNYKVTFPLMSKVVVTGKDIIPLYAFLTSKETDPDHPGKIEWNFEKFLIGRKGEIVARFKSGDKPMSDKMVNAIKGELEKK